MGANLPGSAGPPDATLAAAVVRLEALGRVSARSSLYSTAPIGYADQPRFFNAAAALLVLGTIVLMPGLGFIISAAITWGLARRLGLMPNQN